MESGCMNHRPLRWLAVLFVLAHAGIAYPIDVLQFGYDPSHTGNNPAESIIGAGNVAGLQLMYSVAFPGTDGPPVFLQQATTALGVKDVLFVTTHTGIEAIDAAT